MPKDRLPRPLSALALLFVFALAGCAAGKPSSFYILSGLPAPEAPISATPSTQLNLGLGPVVLPPYLDRPQLVTRPSANRLAMGEFDRWGEPLKDMVSRTLAENLSALLGSDRVFLLPARRTPKLDFSVSLDIMRFDTGADGHSVLAARWILYRGDADEALLIRKSVITEPVIPAGEPEAIVAAMSRALATLSREIARAIQAAAG